MNYYFLMDKKANKTFNFNANYGDFAFEILKDPLGSCVEYSIPFNYIFDKNSPDTIYYNFVDKKMS